MGTVAVDDRDPSVTYSTGDWAQAGIALEFNSTTTWTGVAGSTASISFIGSSIGVYGTVVARDRDKDSVAPLSLYSIDGGTPVRFRADPAGRTQYRQQFFQSPVLPESSHVLTIMYTSIQADPLFLDFFMVDSATLSASSLSTSLSSSSSDPASLSTSSTTTTTPPTPVTVTITSTQAVSTSSTVVPDGLANASGSPSAVSGARKSNAGAVAGGIIGGIAVLLLAAFAFITWRRHQRKRESLYNFKDNNGTSWRRPVLDSPPSPVRPTISLNTPPPPPAPVMSQYTGGQYGDGYYPGRYASASAYNNYQQHQHQQLPHSTYNYTSSEEHDAYGGVAPNPQPYPQQGYIPPSQLLKPALGNDYNNAEYAPSSSHPSYASDTYAGDLKRMS